MNLDIGKPNPKQAEFLRSKKRFTGYGGARGGGKSWAIQTKAKLAALYYPGITILIVRRTFPELRDNHMRPMAAQLAGIAKFNQSEKMFSFPNGSTIIFGYCDTDADLRHFQGNEYDLIFIDEATNLMEHWIRVISACCRGANSFPHRVYMTANPGGPGHMFFKRVFIDREFQPGEDPDDYVFIPARLVDNPVLVAKDPEYKKMLDSLPPEIRAGWRDGDWTVFAGRFYPGVRPETHSYQPRALPKEWPRYRVFDYGLDMYALYWVAIDYDGRYWVYREYKAPDTLVSDAAAKALELTPEGESIVCTLAPPDMWARNRDKGKTQADLFAEYGLPLVKAPNSRIHGWAALGEALKIQPDGKPGLMISEDCPGLMRDLQAIQHDDKNPDDVAKEPHEYTHSPDAIRYMVAAYTTGAIPAQEPEDDTETKRVTYQEYMAGGALDASYLGF